MVVEELAAVRALVQLSALLAAEFAERIAMTTITAKHIRAA